MSRRIRLLILFIGSWALAACSSLPTPSLTVAPTPIASDVPSPTASATVLAQQQICGHLSRDQCERVIAIVQRSVPETKASPLAVADYVMPGDNSILGRPDVYLVAFAPWGDKTTSSSPPTWLARNSEDVWSITRHDDLRSLPVCFIELLVQARLTDYAPTSPAGLCGSVTTGSP
jgi:hypothetical protein